MANIMQLLPDLEGDEQVFVQGLIKEMDDDKAQMFANTYRSRRKDPTTLLLVSLIGFIWKKEALTSHYHIYKEQINILTGFVHIHFAQDFQFILILR